MDWHYGFSNQYWGIIPAGDTEQSARNAYRAVTGARSTRGMWWSTEPPRMRDESKPFGLGKWRIQDFEDRRQG